MKTVFSKPHYLFRPSQVIRRLFLHFSDTTRWDGVLTTRLPWGLPLTYRPAEAIGSSIARTGIYDLCVSETLYRLIDRHELAVDVGANIGYMTSIMAARVGPSGTVIAFEPHPELFTELARNAAAWSAMPSTGTLRLKRQALSSATGSARLYTRPQFMRNRGTCSLCPDESGADSGLDYHEVEIVRLADSLPHDAKIGVMKIDVEGHEREVLLGSRELLARRQIRDILFEEHQPYPTPACRLLEDYGYELFRLSEQLTGLRVEPANAAGSVSSEGPPGFLATIDPNRALRRLGCPGWAIYGVGGRRLTGGQRHHQAPGG